MQVYIVPHLERVWLVLHAERCLSDFFTFLIVLQAEHLIAQRYREQGWVFFAPTIARLKISSRECLSASSPENALKEKVKERKGEHVWFLPHSCL